MKHVSTTLREASSRGGDALAQVLALPAFSGIVASSASFRPAEALSILAACSAVGGADTTKDVESVAERVSDVPLRVDASSKLSDVKAVARFLGIPLNSPKDALLAAIDVVLDGKPAGVPIAAFVATELSRRAKAAVERRSERPPAGEEWRLLSATEAKEAFALTDGDLESLDWIEKKTKYRTSMRLFEPVGVLELARSLRGGAFELEVFLETAKWKKSNAAISKKVGAVAANREAKKRRSKNRRLDLLRAALAQNGFAADDAEKALATPPAEMFASATRGWNPESIAMQAWRHHELSAALKERGLELRDDSRLCESFVMFGEISLAEVVDVMDEMRFFFAHTKYRDFLDREYERRYISRFDEHAKHAASSKAKEKALQSFARTMGLAGLEIAPESLRGRLARFVEEARAKREAAAEKKRKRERS